MERRCQEELGEYDSVEVGNDEMRYPSFITPLVVPIMREKEDRKQRRRGTRGMGGGETGDKEDKGG